MTDFIQYLLIRLKFVLGYQIGDYVSVNAWDKRASFVVKTIILDWQDGLLYSGVLLDGTHTPYHWRKSELSLVRLTKEERKLIKMLT